MPKYDHSEYASAEAAVDILNDATVAPENKLFDIVSVIGSVYAGGKLSPRVAAFMIIAEYGADGEFSFPDGDGATISVGVKRTKGQTV